MEKRKLKRVVVKEELIAITGDYFAAVILNQFMFWAERRKDADKFIAEEKAIALKHGKEINMPLSHGWIYKKTEDMADETMIPLARQTIRRHIQTLVEKGFLDERQNPQYKWDKTIQYRVNLNTINTALNEKGYHLEGYSDDVSMRNYSVSKMDIRGEVLDIREHDFGRAIPKITSEITNIKEETESLSRIEKFENYPSQTQPQSQTPTSTKGICDEASVGVVVGKSKARKNPHGAGGVGSGSAVAVDKSSSVDVQVVQGLSSEEVAGVVTRITAALNVAIDSTFRETDCQKHIVKCLGTGMTEAELMAVVDHVSGWLGDDKQEEYLAPSFIFGSRAGEYARKSRKSGKGKPRVVGKKRQYYLDDPNGTLDAVLVDEDEIPVGTDAWDREGRRIIL